VSPTALTPASALLVLIFIGLAPFVAVMVTSFTKIVVSLSLLRNAIGLQQTPPNLVINGLALILTLYVMYPVGLDMQAAMAKQPPAASAQSDVDRIFASMNAAKEPLRAFLLKHASPRERAFFLRAAKRSLSPARAAQITDQDLLIVVPSFVVGELTAAFQIGFLIFLPFLVIDLVIANILLAMGMMMIPPTTVSLPFKLLLFVMVDGWVKISHGLVLSYT